MPPQRVERIRRRFDPIHQASKVPNKRGPWSPSEDQRLRDLVEDKGAGKWVQIAEVLTTRTPKQCRERWHQNLDPKLNHEPISPQEGEAIETFVGQMGKRWADIARRLNNRSDNAVKNWWNGGENRRKRDQARLNEANAASQYSSLAGSYSQPTPYYHQQNTPSSLDSSFGRINLPPMQNHTPRHIPAPLNTRMANAIPSPTEISPVPTLLTDASSPRYGFHSHRGSISLPTPNITGAPMDRTRSTESWKTTTLPSPAERPYSRIIYSEDRTHSHQYIQGEKSLSSLETLNRSICRHEHDTSPVITLPSIDNLTNGIPAPFFPYHQSSPSHERYSGPEQPEYELSAPSPERRSAPERPEHDGRRRMSLANLVHQS